MEWQPIHTAPRDGRCVLLFASIDDDGENMFVGSFVAPTESGPFGEFIWKEQSGASITAERVVTHWMPLPEPPAQQEGKE